MNELSRFSMLAAVVSVCAVSGVAHAAVTDDFGALRAHWSFDEGRDWHNMTFPYRVSIDSVSELTGKASPLYVQQKQGRAATVDNAAWVSGRQHAGIGPGQVLSAGRSLAGLNGSHTLSYWTRLSGATPNTRGVIGSRAHALWGAMDKRGCVCLFYKGQPVLVSPTPITDNDWHHIVFTRDAANGRVALYQDGKLAATGSTPKGTLSGSYSLVASNNASLDQIHLFDRPISAETVAILHDNHAPQVFAQTHTVETDSPSTTGSILHGFTYDVEHDALSVVSHTQPTAGKVEHLGDGTFRFTPNADFRRSGKTSFEVVVSDGRGGHTKATMHLQDSRHVVGHPVREFRYRGALPAFGDGAGKRQNHRNPMAIQLGGARPDLLVQADSRLWLCRNESRPGQLQFSAPQVLRTPTQADFETDGAAVLSGNRVIIRRPDGSLHQAAVLGGDTPTLEPGAAVQDTTGAAMKLPVRHFVLLDYDHDGTADIIAGFNDGLYCYRGTQTASGIAFAAEKEPVFRRSYNIAPGVGDLNNDGRTELLYGINWGTLHVWMNDASKPTVRDGEYIELKLQDEPVEKFVRQLNGAHTAVADFDGDATPDMVLGGNAGRELVAALGVNPDSWAGNLTRIEQELYNGHERDLGRVLESNNRAGLHRYRELMTGWIRWAVAQKTPAARRAAWEMLAAHVRKYPFLQRRPLMDAWVKSEKGHVTSYGDMHHVPGIFTMNWIVLHRLLPDSAAHRRAVADALGMRGLDREVYLFRGLPIADNNRCSEGQLRATRDMTSHHAYILFPDDHISIGQNYEDGRDAMCYIFHSNKNTFCMPVGNNLAEMHGDMVRLTEQCFGSKGAASGDYFTFVLAHEVCHSLDDYVCSRANKDLTRRWGDQNFYAATNAGLCDDIVANESGWWDLALTQQRFKERGLWNGDKATWNDAWKAYWQQCPYRDKVFMRGQIDWFLGSQQETFATQANHHWARSESRLIGAILRYLQGYKSNINEVVFFLDVLSAGQNKLPLFHPVAGGSPCLVNFNIEYAWLTRNDNGYITDIRIGDRHYGFSLSASGRVIGLRTYPFAETIRAAAAAASTGSK